MARERSPNFPRVTLDEALRRATAVYQGVGRTRVTSEDISIAMGYAGLNGKSKAIIAALNAYGLINRVSKTEYVVSDDMIAILHPASEGEAKQLLRKCALSPKIYALIYEESHNCSGSIITNKLIRDLSFTTEGAALAAGVYEENRKYIEVDECAPDGRGEEDLSGEKDITEEDGEADSPAEHEQRTSGTRGMQMPQPENPDVYQLLLRGPGVNLEIILDDKTNVGVAKMYIEMIERKIIGNE